jgi:pyridoxal phosphate enzyme (YggS family)
MDFLNRFRLLKKEIDKSSNKIKLIVVTKNQDINKINLLINENHNDFGENRLQEAKLKWNNSLRSHSLNLHFLGKIQSNKIKDIVNLFDYVHSLDNIKNAKLFDIEEKVRAKKLKYFIQVNLGNEVQKSGIKETDLKKFIDLLKETNLSIIGLMCIPPTNTNPDLMFQKLKNLADHYLLRDLSMGMSNDYKNAIINGATYIRIGSLIFNKD